MLASTSRNAACAMSRFTARVPSVRLFCTYLRSVKSASLVSGMAPSAASRGVMVGAHVRAAEPVWRCPVYHEVPLLAV